MCYVYFYVRHEENSAMLSYLLFVLCLIEDRGRHTFSVHGYRYTNCSIEPCKYNLRKCITKMYIELKGYLSYPIL